MLWSYIIFGKECPKKLNGIFAFCVYDKSRRKVDMTGLWQLVFLAPVTLPGSSIFRDIKELRPAECAELTEDGLTVSSYWRLEAKPWSGTAQSAAEETGELLADAVRRQTVSDVPLCTFLSGGLDSSALTALFADIY